MYEKALPAELSLAERAEEAASAGYDYIEISIDESDARLARLDWSAAERTELLKLTAGAGVPPGSMCLSAHRKYPLGSHDPLVRARSLEIIVKALALSSDLGIRALQLAGYDVYYEQGDADTERWFTEGLFRAAEAAARYGVVMGFETMETPFMNTTEKAMKYVRLVDSPFLQVYPDLGNVTNACREAGKSVSDDLRTGMGHLIAMHLKETKPGVFREVPFGEGHVDFDAGIRDALVLGVRRFVTEFWNTGEPGWRDTVRSAAAGMRGKIDRAVSEMSAARGTEGAASRARG